MSFRFKQFFVDDTHCAMKVGTDGVLLGAWADVQNARHILDIGCGSGLIALMAAQRAEGARVKGIEIDSDATADARSNAEASPFAARVSVECVDAVRYAAATTVRYDCIVANPPYHEEELLPPSALRARARHTAGGGLTFAALLHVVDTLLYKGVNEENGKENLAGNEGLKGNGKGEEVNGREGNENGKENLERNEGVKGNGKGEEVNGKEDKREDSAIVSRFAVILPTVAVGSFVSLAAAYGLHPIRRTDVVTREGKAAKRTLLELSRTARPLHCDTLVLTAPDGGRSEAYSALCSDFYLDKA